MKSTVRTQLGEHIAISYRMQEDPAFLKTVCAIADACVAALKNGGKLLFMGNGGSAADAQHLAGEIVGRFAYDRPGLPAFALTTDSSVMTAIGNDYGYDQIFARQVQAVGMAGDVLFGFSTSGTSLNILAGLKEARERGLITVGMTGGSAAGQAMASFVDHCLCIPSCCTPRIQEGHILIGHIICGLIESTLFAC